MFRHLAVAVAVAAALLIAFRPAAFDVRLRAQGRFVTVLSTADGHRVHILLTREAAAALQSAQVAEDGTSSDFATVYPSPYDSSLLVDHGGGVMSNPGIFAIYWNSAIANATATSLGYPTISSQLNAFINAFSDRVNWHDAATADYTIVQQYGRTSPISSTLANFGALVESQATLSTISNTTIASHLAGLFAAGTLTPDANTIYSVFFPPGMQVTAGTAASCTSFCAYHSAFSYSGIIIKYAVYPYPGCASCSAGAAADSLTTFISHETRETVTDPVNGWYDPSGNEGDDKCAWSHLYRIANGGFLVQPEWSNGGLVTASGFTASYPGPGCIVPSNGAHRTFGDFDGDGRADLAVFRPSSGTWFINNDPAQVWGTAGDIPVPADYAGSGRMQPAIFRPSTGEWFIQGQGAIAYGAPGDIPVPADYDGDGRADVAVFRPSSGTWFIRGQASVKWGTAGDIPVPGNYAGVGHAQVAVFRRGTWFVFGQSAIDFGTVGDVAVPADYDGNGTTDVAVYRPLTGQWFVRNQFGAVFGTASDIPIPLDLDGDGRAELVLYRPSTGEWRSFTTALGTSSTISYGTAGDIPVAASVQLRKPVRGDADGDRRADLMLFRSSDATWRSLLSSTGFGSGATVSWGTPGDTPVAGDFLGTRAIQPAVFRNGTWSIAGGPTINWGTAGDIPIVADFDGDGRSDLAVFRNGAWYVLYSSTGFTTSAAYVWGTAGDVPVAADFDGDGKADVAVFRGGTWYVLTSSTGYRPGLARTLAWGTAGDVPVAGDYDGDGDADVAVFRPSTGVWYIIRSSDGMIAATVFGGASGDIPVPGDFDGDGRTDIAVYHSVTGTWDVMGQFTIAFGAASDVPVLKP